MGGADYTEYEKGKFATEVFIKGGSGNPFVFWGTVTTYTDTTHFASTDLTEQGNDAFKDWHVYVFHDAGGAGAAPQGESQPISDYVSSTGTFTHAAFTTPLAVGDKVFILHPYESTGTGTFLTGAIDNLNVLTEQDMIPEVTVITLTDIGKISVDYVRWYTDANITGTGATLTIRVYEDDFGGTLREVTNLGDIITEGISGSGKVKLDALGTIERNYKVTVQSSIAPAGGAASNLIKYDYTTFDRE